MKQLLPFCLLLCALSVVSAQEGDNSFGFDDEEESSAFNISLGGNLSCGGPFFFDAVKNFGGIRPSSLVNADLHLEATAPLTEAYFGVRVNDRTIPFSLGEQAEAFPEKPQIPRWINEAYLKIMLGPVVFAGGIQKIAWGQADVLSVLDVINPKDLTDLTVINPQQRKISRPMLNLTAYLPFEMKLDTVFLPVFEGNRFALSGRWLHNRDTVLSKKGITVQTPDTGTLAYAQGGGRFTATIAGLHDVGVQYFYGRLHDAAVTVDNSSSLKTARLAYNPYHHIGIDYGTGIGPVALRLEAAANITHDVHGRDPAVYNPSLAWNAGVEYTVASLRFNAVAAETITLHHKKIGIHANDVEKGSKPTNTTFSFGIAQTLLRQSFEWKLAATVCVEDADFFINPGLHWQAGTLLIDCNLGIFGGKKSGKLGQFSNNSFIQLSLGYEF